MSKLILSVTKTVSPDKKTQEYSTAAVIVVESDKFVILPRDGATKSSILANGWQFDVDSEPAELGAAMSALDVTAYS